MRATQAFVPRDAAVAKKLIVTLTAVATVLTVIFAVSGPPSAPGSSTALVLGCPLLVLALAVAVVVIPEPATWMWMSYPLAATATIFVANRASEDASVTAQLFFFFPVLYAGAQLRRRAAISLCAVAAVAETLTVVAESSAAVAFRDASFVIAALFTVTGILVYSSERVDALIGQLRAQAAIDSLTGLVTRRVLDSATSSSLRSASSKGGTALILVDIDHFKRINDEHGHPVGDHVLQVVAETLRSCTRSTDVASRMGGDELAVLVPGCSLPNALERADQIVGLIRALRIDVHPISMHPARPTRTLVTLTVSIGVAHLPTHAQDVHELYRAADRSLYQAKRAGRDRVGELVALEATA